MLHEITDQKLSLRKIFKKYNLLIILVFLIVVLTISTKGIFLRYSNISNLLMRNSLIAIIALGQTLVILTGGIDLSVGSNLALSSLFYVLFQDLGVFPSIILALASGMFFGFFNGIIITKLRINPFLTTLATMEIIRGLSFTVIEGKPIYYIQEQFLAVSQFKFLGLFAEVYICLIIFAILWFFIRKTRFGVQLYAVGGNENAARLSGIRSDKTKLLAYIIVGLLCGVCGILYTARIGIGEAISGATLHLDSIAAVVIGGAALSGGIGKLENTIIGVLIYGMLSNFMILIGVPPLYQQGVKGAIIILAIFINKKTNKRG